MTTIIKYDMVQIMANLKGKDNSLSRQKSSSEVTKNVMRIVNLDTPCLI